ncbi:P-loop NTPase fold protein [Schaalia hyovaginalis]|uniref:KAP family P-loop NTPase fold protein n=1 Tax=Schaalia hyovaginalis TaxID=29316 RepID=UPI0026EAA076|nr:P-loop NTPase fold protein [Schaalia hyovaginalis]MCI6410457.1 KAP family NTPase [Schaalia hyovaginalis]
MATKHGENTSIGFNDEPATQDHLEIDSYLTVFVNFIKQCPTPMTAAVQGDWGTGKSTALITIENKLKDIYGEKAWILNFNTWQYSQFNLGDQLVFSLIGEILNQIDSKLDSRDENSNRKTRISLIRVAATLKPLARFGASLMGADGAFDAVDSALEAYRSSEQGVRYGPNDQVEAISRLRAELQELVDSVIGDDDGPDRIYIFIDDLDRLDPQRAVEVMEALKVFLNVKNCVFVLAIDFAVVLRGVRAKYGSDFDESKARAFFEKIIQIPFNLPVGAYNMEGMLQEGLKHLRVDFKESDIPTFKRLLNTSVGNNPRATKRLLNTFSLLQEIANAQKDKRLQEAPEFRALELFAVLCLQNGYPEVFNDLLRHVDTHNNSKEFISEIVSNPPESLPESRNDEWKAFISHFTRIFISHSKGSQDLDYDRLNAAMYNAASTSIGTKTPTGRQDHTPNSEVQDMIALIGAHFTGKELAPNATVSICEEARGRTGWTHLRRTRGKGQGLNFQAPNKTDRVVYISGDAAGRLPNDSPDFNLFLKEKFPELNDRPYVSDWRNYWDSYIHALTEWLTSIRP